MQLERSADEVAELLPLLEAHLSDLFSEVRRSHNPTMHDDLIARRHRVQELVRKLRELRD
jgi:hypothetical protein